MSETTRFLVGFRYSATVPQDVEAAIEAFVAGQEGLQEVRRLSGGQRILEMTPEQAGLLAAQRPEFDIEEDIELELLAAVPGLPPRVAPEVKGRLAVRVVDDESGEGIAGVRIYAVGRELAYEGVTDDKGDAGIDIHEPDLRHIVASPDSGYWSKIAAPPEIKKEAEIEIRLQKIPPATGDGWGPQLLGLDRLGGKFTGRGIKIGLIDSGVAQHASLTPTGGYHALTGKDTGWNADEDGHGTHCAGLLTARGEGLKGMAPEAELYPVKVHPGGRLSDFVEAVNWCIENYMDVVSIGVGIPCPSQQMELALLDAYDRGIICVAAAGNDSGAVAYPAAYEHVIAVAAVGQTGEFPEDSAHALACGEPSGYEGLFFAAFSNAGPEIDLCAPGVAIASTVPDGQGARDGTSMAGALVAGLAALVLEAYPEIRRGDAYQSCDLRRILFDSAIDLGLPPELQGAGLASAEAALAAAYYRREQEEADRAAYRRSLKAGLEQAKRQVEDLEQALEEFKGE